MNILINIVIIVCITINFIILYFNNNKMSKLKDNNKYLRERMDYYRDDYKNLEHYNYELLSENIILKQKFDEINNKENKEVVTYFSPFTGEPVLVSTKTHQYMVEVKKVIKMED